MKINKYYILGAITLLTILASCEKNEVLLFENYNCEFRFQDNSSAHPKATLYQNILEKNRKNGLVGAVLLVRDKDGLWIGADGKADIASNVDMQSCNNFLIASISKVFTSAATYRLIDKGILSLEDPVSKWLDEAVVKKVDNAEKAKIKHLLSHTSGIPDYYTLQFELDRINRITNNFTKEKVLKYTYGKSATNSVGETYYYSNTNFLILAMILEKASGLTFEEVYQQEVFTPLELNSAYYSEERPIPEGCVKGYVDIYGNGQYVESEFLYNDELGIGGDGGIAVNAYDLAIFFEGLMKGNLISTSSINEMTNWFDLPEDWTSSDDPYGQNENGYGIEKFNTVHGPAVGHTGGIDGFSTIALYFLNEEATYVLLLNSAGNEKGAIAREEIYKEITSEMFK
ncbi:D-alanyl-D-alanine carboxypeptidase [Marivirga sericea]|uniref:D-alanyl-D-alanine carboxypeptidase n=1 Tax=Marivirga sericea TaxID=1028 RepID=A0A1X7L759_9BACT|nr:serine hydrolase domain-containing protein [Marivirga sericea]SMG49294.1 D-alanyl-D-alanine carboxypeptidase [Marivirga sericea]